MKLTRERSLFEMADSSAQAAMIRAAHVVALEIDRGITSMLLIHSEPQMRQFWSQQSTTTQRNIINAAHAEALEIDATHTEAVAFVVENHAPKTQDGFFSHVWAIRAALVKNAHCEALRENDRFDRLAARHYVFWMGTAANDRAAWLAQDHADALAQDAINDAWESVHDGA